MALSLGKYPRAGVLVLAVAFTLAVALGSSVAEEEDPAARRERALARRERLAKLLAQYLEQYPEAYLDHDGQLTNPERSKHVAKLYRIEKLKELGDRIRFRGDI